MRKTFFILFFISSYSFSETPCQYLSHEEDKLTGKSYYEFSELFNKYGQFYFILTIQKEDIKNNSILINITPYRNVAGGIKMVIPQNPTIYILLRDGDRVQMDIPNKETASNTLTFDLKETPVLIKKLIKSTIDEIGITTTEGRADCSFSKRDGYKIQSVIQCLAPDSTK